MSCLSYTRAGAVSSEQRGFRQGKASLLFGGTDCPYFGAVSSEVSDSSGQ